MRRLSIKHGRKKALFGSEEAAMIAAAGINVAGTIAAAGIQASAAKDAAKQQADAELKAAKQQTDAMSRQNENVNANLEKEFAFTKEQNSERNDIYKDMSMNLQLLAGGQNHNDRLEANKIQVRNGGGIRRKCLQGSAIQSSLRAGNNLKFEVIDGGAVKPIFTTPEGGQMYQIKGNTHDQYHKTKNGYNSGVGIKFEDGNIIEGEGDGSSPKTLAGGGQLQGGEGLYVDSNDGLFISQHGLPLNPKILSLSNGIGIKNNKFVPMKAVQEGMHPRLAFNIQELDKADYGITDSGKEAKFGKRKRCNLGGLNSFNIKDDTYSSTISNTDFDNNFSSEANFVANTPEIYQNLNKQFKLGGRKKAALGVGAANWIGTGITGTGNLAGSLIGWYGNNKAAQYSKEGALAARNYMLNALNNMKYVDKSELFTKDDFTNVAHVMPVFKTARYNIEPQLAKIDRSLQRQLSAARRGNLSSAAMQDRMTNAEINAYDQRSRIYDTQQKVEQDIANKNIDAINRASEINARIDNEALQRYIDANIEYETNRNNFYNDLEAKRAGVNANFATQIAGIYANRDSNNAQLFGNLYNNLASNVGNTLVTNARSKYEADQAKAKYDADFRTLKATTSIDNQIDIAIADNNLADAKLLAQRGEDLTEAQRRRLYNAFKDSLFAKYGTNISKHRSLKR